MQQAFRDWPICINAETREPTTKNDITFVVPHRGVSRLPQLAATVSSILAQEGVNVECIVVEQDQRHHVTGLPTSVKVLHLPHTTDALGWRKAWAFNVGVRRATADVVICHDADILVPKDYGREILKYLATPYYDVCHLQRFLFCVNREDTVSLTERLELSTNTTPVRVRQNWQGGTVAIKKKSFWQIGGYDESFVDWGGEDNEFYDRCQLLRVFKHGYLPFVHLWHPMQQSKKDATRDANLEKMKRLLAIPAAERVKRLVANTVRQSERCG